MSTSTERFALHMSDADALMWNIEKDPILRSTIVAVGILDCEPDFARLRRRLDRASIAIPRLRQRVVTPPFRIGPPPRPRNPRAPAPAPARRPPAVPDRAPALGAGDRVRSRLPPAPGAARRARQRSHPARAGCADRAVELRSRPSALGAHDRRGA